MSFFIGVFRKIKKAFSSAWRISPGFRMTAKRARVLGKQIGELQEQVAGLQRELSDFRRVFRDEMLASNEVTKNELLDFFRCSHAQSTSLLEASAGADQTTNALLQELLAERYPNSRTLRSIQRMLNAMVLHQEVFPKYKNSLCGREVVIVATGPSARHYRPIENAVHIGVNRAFLMENVPLDYLFVGDWGSWLPEKSGANNYLKDLDGVDRGRMKIFFGMQDEETQAHGFIPESLALRHGAERYYSTCANFFPPFIGVGQLDSQMLSEYGSVSFHALQFALYTNPERIYLVGCDSNNGGYFDGRSQHYTFNTQVLDGWAIMKDFAQRHYPDTEIVSINPVGLKGFFRDMITCEECSEERA